MFYFERRLKNSIFATSNIICIGSNRIINIMLKNSRSGLIFVILVSLSMSLFAQNGTRSPYTRMACCPTVRSEPAAPWEGQATGCALRNKLTR